VKVGVKVSVAEGVAVAVGAGKAEIITPSQAMPETAPGAEMTALSKTARWMPMSSTSISLAAWLS
jgi:hypothetical protein